MLLYVYSSAPVCAYSFGATPQSVLSGLIYLIVRKTFVRLFAALCGLQRLLSSLLQYNTIQYNNLFKVVTQGVVAHSPEPGAHDKSARQLKIQN